MQVQVSALWDTSWSVTPNASWISVVDAGSGAGDSTVTLAVGTNPSYAMRTGTVSIGSATFSIAQRGTSQPTLAILPPTATAEAVGAYGNVAVLATPDAPWTAQSLDPWIVISQGAAGAGNGNIQYVVSSNPDLVERTGRILVRPPVYEAPANLSWMLFSRVKSSSTDCSGWNHHLTGSLADRFNGTFYRTMSGDPFVRTDDAFSIALWFNIGLPDTINRLLQAERASNSFTAVYVDASNRLVVQCGAEMFVTDLTVEPNVEYQVVLAANVGRTLNVYAGKRGETMAAVGAKTFSVAPFPTSYITPERIKIGASDLPSAGYLDDETVFGTDGGSAWVDVSTEGNAQWQAVSQVSWLTVAIGASGSGAGSVFIVADPYTQTSSSRIGGVLIAGEMVYFTQRGFELSVVPQVAQVGSNAGAGEFGVVAPIGAIWEAITTHPWITIMGGTSGQGNGTLRYSVAANTTGATRTGKIIVSGKEYTITQLASLLLTAYTDGGGTVAGGGSYETLANATVTATPASGYVFSHWTGDAVGSENPLSLSMDSSKTVKAHFLEVDIADSIALDSRERLGLYTPDQMEDLALGNPVLRRNPENGKMSLFMGVMQRQSLTEGDWTDMVINSAEVFIEGGKVRVDITPSGNAAFYRLKGDSKE